MNRAEEMETEVLHAQRSEETKEGGGKVDENVSSNKVFKIQGGPGKYAHSKLWSIFCKPSNLE